MISSLVGIGIRYQHLLEFNNTYPAIGWVEAHSENYLTRGGVDYDLLTNIAKKYPISLHGIGMSLGSAAGINMEHLAAIDNLVKEINPFLLSEHLSWSSTAEYFLPDLVPFPFNNETLEIFCSNVSYAQDFLDRELLLENPSSYFEYTNSEYSEPEFMNILCTRTGAKILLDLNNVYISGLNNNFDPFEYVRTIKPELVKEIHLAGHSIKDLGAKGKLYIDSHDNKVAEEVWQLYEYTISCIGKTHTLLEWDTNLPELTELITEANKALKVLENIDCKSYV